MAVPFASLSFQFACLVIMLGAFNPTTAIYESDIVIPPDYDSCPDVGMAYKVHTEQRTWSEAKQACMNEGAHLAIIDNMTKVRHIAGMKAFNVYVWIGVSRTGQGAPWVSAGNGMQMSDLPWAPGKPWGPHNCLGVRGCNRGLTNENCSSRLGFVCQMPLTEQLGTIIPN